MGSIYDSSSFGPNHTPLRLTTLVLARVCRIGSNLFDISSRATTLISVNGGGGLVRLGENSG